LADLSQENSRPVSEYLVDGKYSINDLADIEKLRCVLELLSELTGVSVGLVSYPDQRTLISTAHSDMCAAYHWMNADSAKSCLRCSNLLVEKLKKSGDIDIEHCDNGLVDGGTPIIIKDKHIATLFAGQIFLQKPDIGKFKNQAKTYGYDVDKYLEAVNKTPIITESKFRAILSMLGRIASLIMELGYANLDAINKNLRLQEDVLYAEKTEAKILHLNSIFRAISSVSQLIIKEKDKSELLSQTCHILIESRDFRFVWVGLFEKGMTEIKPVAHAGFEGGYLQNLRCNCGDSAYDQCPSSIAINTNKPLVINDIVSSSISVSWRDEVMKYGYRAMISTPISLEDRIFGVINVYSDRLNAFDEQEVKLLSELGRDLGFALHSAEVESERKNSAEALIVSEESYRSIFDAANDAIFTQDIESGRVIDVNQKACEMYMYGKDEMIRHSMGELSLGESPYSQDDFINVINKTSGGDPQLFEWVARDKADRLFWVEINLKRAVINGKYRILAIVRDITDRKQTEDRWEKIHETFLSFGPEPIENINRLTALCGEIMGADSALYNCLEGDVLHTCGQWNTPPDFQPTGDAHGHICYDVIKDAAEDVTVIRNLQETDYAISDPNVGKYNIQTYVGLAVKVGGECIGTLCTIYLHDFEPSEEDKEIMGFIAHAISVEEERRSAMEMNQIAQFSIEHSGNAIFWIDPNGHIVHANNMACISLGYSHEELLTKSVPEQIDPNFIGDMWLQHWKELQERGSFTFESKYRRKDGTEFPVEVTVNYIKFQGNEYSFASVTDITARKNQEEELVRRDYQLEILSRTSQHINAVLEVPTILRTMITAAIELVDAMGGTAGVVAGDKIVFKEYQKDGKINYFDYVFKLGEGLCASITKSLKTHISNDVANDSFMLPEFRERFGLYNVVDVPILNHEGKLLGCIELHNKKNGKTFDAQDVFMLQGMAAGAAVALENANALEQRNKAQQDLVWQKEYYEDLFNEANVWVEVIDKEGRTLLWNKKAEEITGYKREDVIGNLSKWELEYPDHKERSRVLHLVKRLMSSGITIKDLETEIVTFKKTKRIMLWSSTIIHDSYGKTIGCMLVGNDVTERRTAEREKESLNKEITRSNKRLNQLALKDFETGLHNHHYLTEAIEPEFYRAKRYIHPLSVVMIDIDYFRSINDLYGHEFGDMVLKQFAIQLKKMVRRYDVVVRFGGEEFVVLSSGADRTKAVALAHRLMEALSIYNFGDDKRAVKLRMSLSVASYPDDPIESGMDLIYLAEKILDKAKEEGGNKVYSSGDLGNGKGVATSGEPADIEYLRKKISSLTKRGRQSLMESIFAFAKTIEMRDHYTGEHADSTVHYSTKIARALKLNQEEIDHVRQAAILHDLGKVGISDKILLKRSKLTKKEYEEIKKHPQIAADIIRPIKFMKHIIPLILYHHEKWDGTGYPMGIKGNSIPIGARIISIADVYQALTSDRPYRKAFTKEEAMKILKDNVGVQFDPDIVKIFLKILKEEKDRRKPAIHEVNNTEKGKK